MNEQEIENKLLENQASAFRLNPEYIDSLIINSSYHVLPNTTITICVIEVKNGAKFVGKNYGSVSIENNDWELGKKLAYDDARKQIWEPEGYLLKQQLYVQLANAS